MKKCSLSFYPDILDVLYDDIEGRYLQYKAGVKGPADCDFKLGFTDLNSGIYIHYSLWEIDIVRYRGGSAEEVLHVFVIEVPYRIEENVSIRGKIIKKRD
jgi:hypothetical protein